MKHILRTSAFVAAAVPLAVSLLVLSGPTISARGAVSPRLLRCDPSRLPPVLAQQCRALRREEGRRLFEEETFGGNGRTCATCHSPATGTLSPADVQARIADLSDPLFLHDGLDDGVQGTSRIEQRATIRITLPLPAHLTLADDPGATHVVVNRGIASTLNTPALDPALMWDLRDPDLAAQALGAIHNHTQNGIEPTALQLELIAEFQRTAPRFFSDARLRQFAATGIPPALPEGTTDSEKRGRLFFVDAPFQVGNNAGVCALCHGGPMLNTANEFSTALFGNPPGARAFSVGVSETNGAGNPIYRFLVHDDRGDPVEVSTPDIGVLMMNPATVTAAAATLVPDGGLPEGKRVADFANMFKTPTLWGITKTAPYFHDNSAADLDQVINQYESFFLSLRRRGLPAIVLTAQDREDIKAFLKLL